MLGVKERLAGKYALAIFEMADEHQAIEGIQSQMQSFAQALQENRELGDFINNPLVPRISKQELIQRIFGEELASYLLNFILLLIDKDRIGLLNGICKAYTGFVHEREGIVQVKVTSARELEWEQEESLRLKLSEMLKKKVLLDKHLDSRLIGGVVIQVGDKLIDGSVARRLQNIERSIKSIDLREIGVTN